jgi:ABC-type transport system substrate-binding protein
MKSQKEKGAIGRTFISIIVIIVIIVAAVSVYFAIRTTSPSSSSTSTVSTPKILTIDTAEWPPYSLSPTNNNYPDWYYADVYQSLIMLNDSLIWSKGQVQYVPALAENWTVSNNNMTYTFNLRQGVKFSNGDPFNAYQVWTYFYTLYYMSANSSGFVLGYDIFKNHMANVDFGPTTLSLLTSSGLTNPSSQVITMMRNQSWPIYITGPYQIVFQLNNPFQWFPALLCPVQIWDLQWELQHGGPGTPAAPTSYMNTNPAPGTGPYMVTGFSQNSFVKFSQNPNYWGKNLTSSEIAANVLLNPGHVPSVIMYYRSDDVARFTDLSSGAAQIADILSSDWSSIKTNPNTYNYVVSPTWSSTAFGIALNTQLYPTNTTAFRQAIFHAINYSDVINKALGGEGVVGMAPEYPSFKQFYDLGNLAPYSYNLSEAIQILKQNGIDTSSLPDLTLEAVSGCDWCLNAAQVIQSDLSQINVTVNIDVVLGSTYYPYAIGPYSSMVNNKAQLGNVNFVCALSATPDAFTPADAWTTFVSNQSQLCNLAVYSNPIVQQCVSSWFNGSSVSQITGVCTQAQKQIYNDAPYVFFVPRLWWIDGSTVWLKNGPVASFYMDPEFSGENTEPFFNTVTFK